MNKIQEITFFFYKSNKDQLFLLMNLNKEIKKQK